jgi:hypothetical protein
MAYPSIFHFNRRLLFGIVLSVIVHAMVLSFSGGVLLPQRNMQTLHELDVYLQAHPTSETESKFQPEKTVLSRKISTYRVSGKPHRIQPVEVAQETKDSGTSPSSERAESTQQGSLIGFSFPRAIGLPWLPPEVSVRPVQQHERPIEAYRAMHEAKQMAAQKLAMREQMIGALTAGLEEENQETNGHCTVSRSSESHSLKVDCAPVQLEEMLREKHAGALNTLLSAAGVFEIAFSQNKVSITVLSQLPFSPVKITPWRLTP